MNSNSAFEVNMNKRIWSLLEMDKFAKEFLKVPALWNLPWFYNGKLELDSKHSPSLLRLATLLNRPRDRRLMEDQIYVFIGNLIHFTRGLVRRSQRQPESLKELVEGLPSAARRVVLLLDLPDIAYTLETGELQQETMMYSRKVKSFATKLVKAVQKAVIRHVKMKQRAICNEIGAPRPEAGAPGPETGAEGARRATQSWDTARFLKRADVVRGFARETGADVDMMLHLWLRMYRETLRKLSEPAGAGGAGGGAGGAAGEPVLSVLEWRLADLALMHEPDIALVFRDSELVCPARSLEYLFCLVTAAVARIPRPPGVVDALFGTRAPGAAPAAGAADGGGESDAPGPAHGRRTYEEWLCAVWTAVHIAYCKSGRVVSSVLLQRRWHELWRAVHGAGLPGAGAPGAQLGALLLALGKRFPATRAAPPAWPELVRRGLVVDLTSLGCADPDLLCLLDDIEEKSALELEKIDDVSTGHRAPPDADTDPDTPILLEDDAGDAPQGGAPLDAGDTLLRLRSMDPSAVEVSILLDSDTEEETPPRQETPPRRETPPRWTPPREDRREGAGDTREQGDSTEIPTGDAEQNKTTAKEEKEEDSLGLIIKQALNCRSKVRLQSPRLHKLTEDILRSNSLLAAGGGGGGGGGGDSSGDERDLVIDEGGGGGAGGGWTQSCKGDPQLPDSYDKSHRTKIKRSRSLDGEESGDSGDRGDGGDGGGDGGSSEIKTYVDNIKNSYKLNADVPVSKRVKREVGVKEEAGEMDVGGGEGEGEGEGGGALDEKLAMDARVLLPRLPDCARWSPAALERRHGVSAGLGLAWWARHLPRAARCRPLRVRLPRLPRAPSPPRARPVALPDLPALRRQRETMLTAQVAPTPLPAPAPAPAAPAPAPPAAPAAPPAAPPAPAPDAPDGGCFDYLCKDLVKIMAHNATKYLRRTYNKRVKNKSVKPATEPLPLNEFEEWERQKRAGLQYFTLPHLQAAHERGPPPAPPAPPPPERGEGPPDPSARREAERSPGARPVLRLVQAASPYDPAPPLAGPRVLDDRRTAEGKAHPAPAPASRPFRFEEFEEEPITPLEPALEPALTRAALLQHCRPPSGPDGTCVVLDSDEEEEQARAAARTMDEEIATLMCTESGLGDPDEPDAEGWGRPRADTRTKTIQNILDDMKSANVKADGGNGVDGDDTSDDDVLHIDEDEAKEIEANAAGGAADVDGSYFDLSTLEEINTQLGKRTRCYFWLPSGRCVPARAYRALAAGGGSAGGPAGAAGGPAGASGGPAGAGGGPAGVLRADRSRALWLVAREFAVLTNTRLRARRPAHYAMRHCRACPRLTRVLFDGEEIDPSTEKMLDLSNAECAPPAPGPGGGGGGIRVRAFARECPAAPAPLPAALPAPLPAALPAPLPAPPAAPDSTPLEIVRGFKYEQLHDAPTNARVYSLVHDIKTFKKLASSSNKLYLFSLRTGALGRLVTSPVQLLRSSGVATEPKLQPSPGVATEPRLRPSPGVATAPQLRRSLGVTIAPQLRRSPGVATKPQLRPSPGLATEPQLQPSSGVATEPHLQPSPGLATEPQLQASSGLATEAQLQPSPGGATELQRRPIPGMASKSRSKPSPWLATLPRLRPSPVVATGPHLRPSPGVTTAPHAKLPPAAEPNVGGTSTALVPEPPPPPTQTVSSASLVSTLLSPPTLSALLSAPSGSTVLSAPQGSTMLSAPQGSTMLSAPQGPPMLSAPQGSTMLSAPPGSTVLSATPGPTVLSAPPGPTVLSAPNLFMVSSTPSVPTYMTTPPLFTGSIAPTQHFAPFISTVFPSPSVHTGLSSASMSSVLFTNSVANVLSSPSIPPALSAPSLFTLLSAPPVSSQPLPPPAAPRRPAPVPVLPRLLPAPARNPAPPPLRPEDVCKSEPGEGGGDSEVDTSRVKAEVSASEPPPPPPEGLLLTQDNISALLRNRDQRPLRVTPDNVRRLLGETAQQDRQRQQQQDRQQQQQP